jgi:hypothetical protein
MGGTGALAPRWRGQRGRLEVLYATLSDPTTGVGVWVHHELVSPVTGDPYVHGWAAVFRPGAPPALERFGPEAAPPETSPCVPWPTTAEAVVQPPMLKGSAGTVAWELRWEQPEDPRPLFTFPSWAWERELLPGAQIVPVASAPFTGSLRVGDDELTLSPGTRGALAHVYGHGNAERWGWLHAELGGGDVLEVVAAVSRRPGLDRLAPLPFVQLRSGGRDWPRDPLAAAPLLRARLGLPRWEVGGTVGRWRLRAEVEIPDTQAVSVAYVDPDGAGATCTNSEVAHADIVLEHRRGRWETAASWQLRGSAHAEIGTRP